MSDWTEVVAYGPLYELQLACRSASHVIGHWVERNLMWLVSGWVYVNVNGRMKTQSLLYELQLACRRASHVIGHWVERNLMWLVGQWVSVYQCDWWKTLTAWWTWTRCRWAYHAIGHWVDHNFNVIGQWVSACQCDWWKHWPLDGLELAVGEHPGLGPELLINRLLHLVVDHRVCNNLNLKVVTNEKQGVSGRRQMIDIGLGTW